MCPRSLPIHQLHHFPRLCSSDLLIFPSFLPPFLARRFDSLSPAPAFSNPRTITDDNPHCEIQRTAARNGIRQLSGCRDGEDVVLALAYHNIACVEPLPDSVIPLRHSTSAGAAVCASAGRGYPSMHLAFALPPSTATLPARARHCAMQQTYRRDLSSRRPRTHWPSPPHTPSAHPLQASRPSRGSNATPAARLLHAAFVRVAACLVLATHSAPMPLPPRRRCFAFVPGLARVAPSVSTPRCRGRRIGWRRGRTTRRGRWWKEGESRKEAGTVSTAGGLGVRSGSLTCLPDSPREPLAGPHRPPSENKGSAGIVGYRLGSTGWYCVGIALAKFFSSDRDFQVVDFNLETILLRFNFASSDS
ncbi:hypothetical protein B0H13DRAFT_2313653 [Mycena leptocephala]|nr:hypothetical protein B0H13DRAFT_2313653 [Mycena leptocephala]